MLSDMDLVTLTVQLSPERPARKYFAIVKEVVTRKCEGKDREKETIIIIYFP